MSDITFAKMRKQLTPFDSLPSGAISSPPQNMKDGHTTTLDKCFDEYHCQSFSSFVSQFEDVDSDQSSNPYFDVDGRTFDEQPSPFLQSFEDDLTSNSYYLSSENPAMSDSWNPAEPFPPFQFNDRPHEFMGENGAQFTPAESIFPSVLQCGVPTVTNYGAVTILLRHLIRVDITCNGSVSVYNFPSTSITTLSSSGKKCYVQHPNGRVFQDGPDVHMITANSRYVKITHKGILFSPTPQAIAYLIDESSTKTTSGKFMDLNNGLVMNVFYDNNHKSYERLQEESYRMAIETKHQSYPNGSESWVIGKIRVKQDRWGEVTVTQRNDDELRTIMASPTIRRATVESQGMNVNIDCYSKNYFVVRKDPYCVTSGFCGLIVQNKSQRAGLDRLGRLVLF